MKFTIVKDPIPFLIIDDTYNKEEQILIGREIDFLSSKLLGPEKTSSATGINSEIKKNTGIFLDEAYLNRSISDILQVNRKIFSLEVLDKLSECHYAYNSFKSVNKDTTLLTYYDDEGSYFNHKDEAAFSVVTWFYKEPRNFTGGDFIFSDYDLNIEVKNNRTVIFFSSYIHEVTKVSLIHKEVPYSGRFTISQFCKII